MNDTPDNNTSSTNDSEWEDEMSSEFERRVRGLHEAPLDLSSVKGKAMKIRTKRRAYVAGSIVAAAAAIVPVAIIAGGGTQQADTIPAATSSPSVTPTTSATDPVTSAPTPDPEPTETPAGDALGFSYLEAGKDTTTLHEKDGTTVQLPGAYTDAAVLGDLVAAYRMDDRGRGFVDVYGDGAVSTTYEVRGPMVITPTESAVAFITTDNEIVALDSSGEPQSLGEEPNQDFYLAAMIGDGDCVMESGCHPFLNDGAGASDPYEINYEGPSSAPVPGAIKINDAADGYLVTAQLSYSDTGSCGALWDRQQGKAVFETCDSQVLDISPQGDYVIGTSPYGDGLGPNYFSILDGRTGKEVARYGVEGGFVADMAWADDTHVVATIYDGAKWSILSLAVDSSIETLVGPTGGSDEASPIYYLTGGS